MLDTTVDTTSDSTPSANSTVVASAPMAQADLANKQGLLDTTTANLTAQNQNNAVTTANTAATKTANQLAAAQLKTQQDATAAQNNLANAAKSLSPATPTNNGTLDASGTLTLPNGQKISPQDPNYQTYLKQYAPLGGANTPPTSTNGSTPPTNGSTTGTTDTSATSTDTTGTTATNPTDNTATSQATLDQQVQDAYDQHNAALDSITNGTYPLTPDQQAQIDDMKLQFEQLRQQQLVANKNYEGAMTTLGIVSGRNRYAPEIESGNLKQAVDEGVQKIADINSKMNSTIGALRQGFMDQDYERINRAYDDFNALADKKQARIDKMSQDVKDAAKAQMDQQQFNLNVLKAQQDISQKTIDSYSTLAAGNLTGDSTKDLQTISDMATQLGVDPNQLYNAALKQKQTTDQANKLGGDFGTYIQAKNQGLIPAGTTFSDFQNQLHPENVLNAQEKQLQVQKLQQQIQQGAISGAGGGFNEDVTNFWAQAASSGVNLNSLLPSLGMGQAAVGLKEALLTKIANNASTLGIDGATFGAILTDSRAKQKAYSTLQNQGTLLATNEAKATKDFGLVKSLGTQLDKNSWQTASPVLNNWLRTGQLATTGNPAINNYLGALTTTLTAYAKVVGGQTTAAGVTQGMNDEIQNLIGKGLSTSAVNSYIDNVALPEMSNTVSSYNQSLKDLFGNIQSAQSSDNSGGLGNSVSLQDYYSQNPSQQANIDSLIQDNPNLSDDEIMQIISPPLNNVGSDTNQGAKTGARTDRNNNPTAFTTSVAKDLGLVKGVDYTDTGDTFSNGKYTTAKLLGNPVATTIKGLDKGGFYTSGGAPRWTYLNNLSSTNKNTIKNWSNASYSQKVAVVKDMYQHEGGTQLKQYFA